MNLCIVNEDHPQCNVLRKAIKACQGRGRGALLLREWRRRPFSSTGLGRPCVFVYCRHNARSCRPGSASQKYFGHKRGAIYLLISMSLCHCPICPDTPQDRCFQFKNMHYRLFDHTSSHNLKCFII